MSYDLCFWREEPGLRQNPRAVYDALINADAVDGLLQFPIESFLVDVEKAFPTAVRESTREPCLIWQSADQKSMFEITWSPVHLHATLRSVGTDDANRIVEIAAKLGAPLYDPQTGERFDSWTDG